MIVPGLGSGPWDWDGVLRLLPDGLPVVFLDATASACRAGPSARLDRDGDWQPGVVAGRLRDRLRCRPGAQDGSVLWVGHSSGALSVQSFIHCYPEECVAAVLVDGSHVWAAGRTWSRFRLVGRFLGHLVAVIGLLPLVAPAIRRIGVRTMSVRGIDPLTARQRRDRYGTRSAAYAVLDGWFGHSPLQTALLAVHAAGPPSVPVRVVAGIGRPGRHGPDERWASVQRDLAVRVGDLDPVLLADAAHLLPLDRPDAIAAAVCELLPEDEAGDQWHIS